jgi:hypothetical protein
MTAPDSVRVRRRQRGGACAALLLLLCAFTPTLARADTVIENEPNDTAATANATTGVGSVGFDGVVASASDVDFASYIVGNVGTPVPPFSAAVQALVSGSSGVHMDILGPDGAVVVGGDIAPGELYFGYNPAAIGGTGTYLLRFTTTPGGSGGAYHVRVSGVADGGGTPPYIVGTGSFGPAGGLGVPGLSFTSLLLLAVGVAWIGRRALRPQAA